MKFRVLTLVLATLISGALFSQEKPTAINVPMEILKTGHIVVQVKVNDKGPFRLVFDTGAPVTLISNRMAKEAKVSNKSLGPTPFGAAGQAKVKSMQVGDLPPVEASVIIMDHPTVSAMSRFFGTIDGIVGHSFFARYKVTLDYQKATIGFEPTDFVPIDAVQSLMKQIIGPKSNKPMVAPQGYWGFGFAKETLNGLELENIISGSPAETAGLAKGDVIISLNSRWTFNQSDFISATEKHTPGKKAILRVSRNGKERLVEITPVSGL